MNLKMMGVIEDFLLTQQAEAMEKLRSGPQGLGLLGCAYKPHADEKQLKQHFYYLFAICQRWFPRQPLCLNTDTTRDWPAIDPFGKMTQWSAVELARLYVLLKFSQLVNQAIYQQGIDELFRTADVGELILLVSSLDSLPDAEIFLERAREAARSNMVSVFCAIAHKSSFARKFFDDSAWNQLVLKAAFLAVPIWCIDGLRERNNVELVAMLKHYVWERQAASRVVPWDIWICIVWLARSHEDVQYIQAQFPSASRSEKAAIILSLREHEIPEKIDIPMTELDRQTFEDKNLSWTQIASWME